MRSQIHIENDRLRICGLTDRDLSGLTAMRECRQIYRYEPTFLAELQGAPEEALKEIQGMDLYTDRQCILGIFEKTDPQVLAGLAEFYDYKLSGKVISIGYRLRPEYWGKGLASCCCKALLDFLQNSTGVELVTAHVISDNKASSRSLLKNGFIYLVTKTEDWGHDRPTIAEVYTFDVETR